MVIPLNSTLGSCAVDLDRAKKKILWSFDSPACSLVTHRAFRNATHTSIRASGERRKFFHASAGTCHLSIARIAGFSHLPLRTRVRRPFLRPRVRELEDLVDETASVGFDNSEHVLTHATHAFAALARARERRETTLGREQHATWKPSPGWLTPGVESKNRRASRPRTLRSVTVRGERGALRKAGVPKLVPRVFFLTSRCQKTYDKYPHTLVNLSWRLSCKKKNVLMSTVLSKKQFF